MLDGFGFLDERTTIPALRDVPVIVLTAMDMNEVDTNALNERISALVQKGAGGRGELLRLLDRVVPPRVRRASLEVPRPEGMGTDDGAGEPAS